MMANENKDRLGDKLRDAEKAREDEYFARRDRELLEKMRKEQVGSDEQHGEKKGER
jgi:hypothetical protein